MKVAIATNGHFVLSFKAGLAIEELGYPYTYFHAPEDQAPEWFGFPDRGDPRIVSVLEEMGDDATPSRSTIKIVEVSYDEYAIVLNSERNAEIVVPLDTVNLAQLYAQNRLRAVSSGEYLDKFRGVVF